MSSVDDAWVSMIRKALSEKDGQICVTFLDHAAAEWNLLYEFRRPLYAWTSVLDSSSNPGQKVHSFGCPP